MDRAPHEISAALAHDAGATHDAQDELACLRRELAEARNSQQLLHSTLDATSDGILTLQHSNNAIYFNSRFAQMWHIPEAQIGRLDREALVRLQATRVKDPKEQIKRVKQLLGNPDQDGISHVEMLDGRVLERHVSPQRIQGRCVGSVITFRDVTDRLARDEEMMFNQLVLDNAGPMFWLDCGNGKITYANPGACKELGLPLDQVLGRRVSDWDSSFTRERAQAVGEELTRTGKPVTFESQHRLDDGRVREVEITVFKSSLATRSVYICAFKDLTEQKAAARENRRQEATLISLIDSIPDTIAFKDPDGRYLGCNKAFSEMTGYRPEQLVGHTVLELFPKERAEPVWAEERALMSGLQPRAVEDIQTYPDGTQYCMEMLRSPLRDQDGSIIGMLAIGRNVTERRKAEEDIRRAKEIAEEATRMKSDFLANMSHEIRTPMNAIIGLSHLVLKTDLTARQRDYIAKVQTSGQHLLGVINDILDFSKVEAGKLDLEASDFDLASLLDNTGALLGEKIQAKGLELQVEVAPDVPPVLVGDPLRLGQILINYANNAVKFTERGQIAISVSVSQRTESAALLHFRVRDTGIGLTSDQMGRLFQSFSQGDTSTTRKFGGTGLGLAISRQLAELMGGEVGVESEFGKGSTFWFTARLGIGTARPAEAAPAAAAAHGNDAAPGVADGLAAIRGARILLVEDNDINQEVAREMLQDAGLVVEVAANGQIALAMVQQAPYDLVFMDMQMPVMDGVTATVEIRRRPLLRNLPIVAMTANAMEQDLRRCIDAGMDDFLVKPIDPPSMWAVLLRWIRPAAQPVTAPDPSAPGNPLSELPEDIPGLDTALGLSRMMGKKKLYLEMLARFVKSHRGVAEEISMSLAFGDAAAAERMAHTAKGVGGSIGASALQAAASELEQALKDGVRGAALQRRLREFETTLTALIEALDRCL